MQPTKFTSSIAGNIDVTDNVAHNGWRAYATIEALPHADVPWSFDLRLTGGAFASAHDARKAAIVALDALRAELEAAVLQGVAPTLLPSLVEVRSDAS